LFANTGKFGSGQIDNNGLRALANALVQAEGQLFLMPGLAQEVGLDLKAFGGGRMRGPGVRSTGEAHVGGHGTHLSG
jgi:hypothetical protein